jgi:hypothetical protein
VKLPRPETVGSSYRLRESRSQRRFFFNRVFPRLGFGGHPLGGSLPPAEHASHRPQERNVIWKSIRAGSQQVTTSLYNPGPGPIIVGYAWEVQKPILPHRRSAQFEQRREAISYQYQFVDGALPALRISPITPLTP